MPSTWSLRFRLNYQAPGDSLNAWGTILNQQVFQPLEDAIAKRVAFALSGAKTLSTANGLEDEARCAFLDVTGGAGGSITAPAVEKWYIVRNAASGDVTITSGGGSTAVVKPGEVGLVVCDAINFRRAQFTDMGNGRLTGLADPLEPQDAVTRSYVDGLAFGGAELPGQLGNSGKFLTTNGTTASWGDIGVTSVRAATSGATYVKNAAGAVLGGFSASSGGALQLLNAAGNRRLQSDPNGTITAYTDGGVGTVLASQNHALGLAVAMAVAL